MNGNAAAKVFSGPAGYALAIGVAGVVFYVIYKTLGSDLKKGGAAVGGAAATLGTSIWNSPGSADSSYNLNAGSPYAGYGVVGSLGNVTNQASGGVLAAFGSWIAGKVADVTLPYDPNANNIPRDRNTPPPNATTVSNPIGSNTSILPYSYKQATIDTPAMLNTDQLFTPDYGSAGAYSDQAPDVGASWF